MLPPTADICETCIYHGYLPMSIRISLPKSSQRPTSKKAGSSCGKKDTQGGRKKVDNERKKERKGKKETAEEHDSASSSPGATGGENASATPADEERNDDDLDCRAPSVFTPKLHHERAVIDMSQFACNPSLYLDEELQPINVVHGRVVAEVDSAARPSSGHETKEPKKQRIIIPDDGDDQTTSSHPNGTGTRTAAGQDQDQEAHAATSSCALSASAVGGAAPKKPWLSKKRRKKVKGYHLQVRNKISPQLCDAIREYTWTTEKEDNWLSADLQALYERNVARNSFGRANTSSKNSSSSTAHSSSSSSPSRVDFWSVELFDEEGRMVAGELGYTNGGIYTSLTGFYRHEGHRTAAAASGAGSAQLYLLGDWLIARGVQVWDLGMDLPYKAELGARVVSREDWLELVRELRVGGSSSASASAQGSQGRGPYKSVPFRCAG
eukprot:g359.t1